jgi:hypothetical protein
VLYVVPCGGIRRGEHRPHLTVNLDRVPQLAWCPQCGEPGIVTYQNQVVGVAVEDSIQDPFTGEITVRYVTL